jgi:protein-S-isoprenylcysteine O-methyltransferase Ste14
MDPFLFRDSTAQTVFGASAAAVALREWSLQWRTRGTRSARSDRGTYWILAVALVGAATSALRAPDWVPALSLSGGAAWPFVVGLAIFWMGAGLRWWAIHTLGRFFQLTVVVQEGQTVVDTGPYRALRHPSYTGALLMYLGLGVACDNALSVVLSVALVLAAFLRRIRVEEAVLAHELGEPYRAYARRTRRLIPGVW